MAGLTATGFAIPTLDEIKTELEEAFEAAFGPSINTLPASVFGQLIGIWADREFEIWQLAQAVWASQYPDTASGISLDYVSAITGTIREDAKRSTVIVTLGGTPGTLVATGTIFAVSGTGKRFRTVTDATIGGGGTVDVKAESEEYGAIIASAGSLTAIETPVGGLDTVTNTLDAELGNSREVDADLRARRDDELRAAGAATVDAIRADILRVADVSECKVFENVTDTTNLDGLPPRSVEVLVQDGDAQEIANTIWASKPAGIATYGALSETVVDASGTSHNIYFTRPTAVEAWITVNISVDEDFPADGAQQIEEAITAFGQKNLLIGSTLYRSQLFQVIDAIPGTVDITSITLGLAASPVGVANIVPAQRERLLLDTSRIVVNVTVLP
jgi:uncharacterized phage protein gp47/JayE